MKALRNYQSLIDQVENIYRRIQKRHAEHISCDKGCAGNCCCIHLSVFPIEAIPLAIALKELPREVLVTYDRKPETPIVVVPARFYKKAPASCMIRGSLSAEPMDCRCGLNIEAIALSDAVRKTSVN